MLEKAMNPQNYFYYCALATLFDQEDKLQFMLDVGNRLYHFDAARTFNMDEDMMSAIIKKQLNSPVGQLLFSHPYEKAGSNYWSTLLAGTGWIEDFQKEHGDDCVSHLLHPLYAIQEIP